MHVNGTAVVDSHYLHVFARCIQTAGSRLHCIRFQTQSSMTAANRKWISGVVSRKTSVIFRWLVNVWGWPSRSDRLAHQGPLHCRSAAATVKNILKFTSPMWNSRNSSKNNDRRTGHRSETPPLYPPRWQKVENDWTNITWPIVWYLIKLMPL